MSRHLMVPIPLDNDHPPPLSSGSIRRTYKSPPTVSGFAPLPPITASPICTSTASATAHTQITNRLSLEAPAESSSGYLTPPTTPSESSHQVPLPTWVAVPPTPPAKLLARYLTCEPGQPRSPQLPPSVSSPASHPTRDCQMKYDDPKRRASFPLHKTDCSVQTTSEPDMLVSVSLEEASIEKPHKRPIFHVEEDTGSDAEDVVIPFVDSPPEENAEFSTPVVDDKKNKEQIRRYFVLLELLSTEIGYLTDLQTLVKVYLRLLSTWPCKGPSSFTRNSSFTTAPRLNPSHLQPPNITPLTPIDIKSSTTLYPPWDKERPLMFSSSEMTTLSRNIVDVLELHERFVDELRVLMESLGFPIPSDDLEVEYFQQQPDLWVEKIDDAIRLVSAKFATEASRFNSYQIFCAGHSEALTLVHKAQHQYSAEWKQFQRQCSLGSPSVEEPTERPQLLEDSAIPDRTRGGHRNRTQSTSSTDSIIHAIRRKSRNGSSDALPDVGGKPKGNRLNLTDYLIKPIQRICKYPLLLEQLKYRGIEDKITEDLDVVVESATQAMRHVATAVDEARNRQEITIRSTLIALRVGSTLSLTNASLSSTRPYSSLLTASFLSSLGMCLLAGSLDVMHAKGTSIPKMAKYYGAFLYPGGYLILVKVRGKTSYEPRHWFPLSEMTVVDINISEALFPFSFGLSNRGHRFELAASCQREKEIWLASIQESLTMQPGWVNEPHSSLNADIKGDINACDQLPTPESGGSIDAHIPLPSRTADPPPRESISEEPRTSFDSSPRIDASKALASRRSSTTSVKAIFSSSMAYHQPPSPTMIISRSSQTARHAVDQALQDVTSEVCISARLQANNREESLFPVSKLAQSNRSLGKNRLSRHESVRVVRKKSFVAEGSSEFGLMPPIPSRARSLIVRPSVCPPQGEEEIDELANSLGELRSTPRSNTPSSVSSSPVRTTRNLSRPHKNTRSMIGDLRELFGSRLASSSSISLQDDPKKLSSQRTAGFSLLRRWSRSGRHRRANSAPELPEESIQAKDGPHPVLPDIDFGTDLLLPGSPNSATPNNTRL